MTNTTPKLPPPTCSDHNELMQWGETEFTYREDGVEVVVRHIPAWICPCDSDDSVIEPGMLDELIATIRQLVDAAKQARSDAPSIPRPEYMVKLAA